MFPKQLNNPRFDIIASPELSDIKISFRSGIQKNTKYIIFATPMLKEGRNIPQTSKYRIIAILDHTCLSGYSLLNEYKSVFQDTVNDTNRIAFRIKPVSTISGLNASDFAVLQAPDSKPLILKTKFANSILISKTRTSKFMRNTAFITETITSRLTSR